MPILSVIEANVNMRALRIRNLGTSIENNYTYIFSII